MSTYWDWSKKILEFSKISLKSVDEFNSLWIRFDIEKRFVNSPTCLNYRSVTSFLKLWPQKLKPPFWQLGSISQWFVRLEAIMEMRKRSTIRSSTATTTSAYDFGQAKTLDGILRQWGPGVETYSVKGYVFKLNGQKVSFKIFPRIFPSNYCYSRKLKNHFINWYIS